MADARHFLLFFNFFILLFYTSTLQASRVGPSSMQWMQTNTQHFHIIHDKNQQDLGLYYAQVAETAYANLSTVFSTLPSEITLVLADNTDSSNGNATVFPYPLIFAFPVQVGQQDTLSEAGEWGKELLTHELTHVAQLYPYSWTGYKIARAIFGSIVSPNLLMPNWWKEGMAVEMETQFSTRGRTRSYLQDAQIRAYVAKNKLSSFSLGEANENLVTWPYGNRRYFFGSMMMSQISTEAQIQNKPTALGQIVLDQSNRLPYVVNSPVEDILKMDYSALYDKTLAQYSANSQKQIATLSQVSLSKTVALNENLIQSRAIKYSESQNIIAFVATTDMRSEIEFYKQDSNYKLISLNFKHIPAEDLGDFSFHPRESKIVYSKSRQVSLQQNFSDLYIYDMTKEKSERLTHQERARDPIFAPDGQFILYTNTANGLTELRQINVVSKEIKSVLKNDIHSRINSYTYKNQNEILYTVRDSHGNQQLYLLDLNSMARHALTSPQQIRSIQYKNNLLYFISTENEVSNVYSAEVIPGDLKNVRPLTHLMTGAMNFDVDDKKQTVYMTVVGENGPYVTSTSFLPLGTTLPKIKNEILDRYPVRPDQVVQAKISLSDYSIWPYIYPHYWIPFINTNVTGDGLLYQALTSGSDPLGQHAYNAQINYDSNSQKMGYALTYMNSQWDWEWDLSAYQVQQLFGIDNYIRKNFYSLSIIPNMMSLNEDLLFGFGVTVNQTEDTALSTNHLGGYVQIGYNSIKQKVHHYFPMTGLSLLARYQNLVDQNNLTNTAYGDYSQALVSLTSYNHWFFPKDHTLMIKFDGLYTFEDMALRFGTSNLSIPSDLETQPLFLVRGYQAGQFLGTQMGSLNLEYRFPLADLETGGDTFPFFMKYLTGGIVADALTVKGLGYTAQEFYKSIKLSEQIYNVGAEVRLSTTVGYLLPVNLIVGVYFPLSKEFAKDQTVGGLSLQIGGF